MTCGAQRIEYRSWTRVAVRPSAGWYSRCSRIQRAQSAWPGWGFASKIRASKWLASPRRTSLASAVIVDAVRASRRVLKGWVRWR